MTMNKFKEWHEYLFPRFRIVKWQWINEETWKLKVRFTVEERKELFKYCNVFLTSPYESLEEARSELDDLYKKYELEKTIIKREVIK